MPCARRAPFVTPPRSSIQLTVISVCGCWSGVSHGSPWRLPPCLLSASAHPALPSALAQDVHRTLGGRFCLLAAVGDLI